MEREGREIGLHPNTSIKPSEKREVRVMRRAIAPKTKQQKH